MTCDILIRTCRRDLPWLDLCLAAVERFARGFGQVVVVLPRGQEPWLRRHRELPSWCRLELCPDYADDYLGQQVTKLHADAFTDAELVCHLDSDCVLRRVTTPDDLAPDGRPWIVARPYAELGRHWPWRACTEEFLGWPVDDDFMQRPPFVYPRSLYGQVRAHCAERHRHDIDTWVLGRPARGFSEFNAMGAFARARRPRDFRWLDAPGGDPPDQRCLWYWSRDGVTAQTRRDVAAVLVDDGPS